MTSQGQRCYQGHSEGMRSWHEDVVTNPKPTPLKQKHLPVHSFLYLIELGE